MTVKVPSPLYSYTANRSVVEATGATLDSLTWDLDHQFPGIRFRIIDEQDKIRPHIKFFRNGNQIQDLKTLLNLNDDITIIQAFSGG